MKEIYRYSDGYYPRIYEDQGRLIYDIPVGSGAVSMSFEFIISEQDFQVLKSDAYRFKILNSILFKSIQDTFGIGHPKPRKFTQEEFDNKKKKVLYFSDSDLEEFIKINSLSEIYMDKT